MLNPEQSFWTKIRDNLKLDFIERFENSIAPGWPDVHYCHGDNSGWLELKVEKKFPNKIKFEKAQPNWLTRYWSAGGYCYIWLYVEDTNTIYIWQGKYARTLNESGGTKKAPIFLEIKANSQGWVQLYDIFKLHPIQRV